MKQAMFLFLTLCCLAATMVPRDTEETKNICDPSTPCLWMVYKGSTKIVESVLNNDYCVCNRTQTCQASEFERSTNAYIYRCQTQKNENNEDQSYS